MKKPAKCPGCGSTKLRLGEEEVIYCENCPYINKPNYNETDI